ncbi:unnamed protein product, partial [marine sediment metagenome]
LVYLGFALASPEASWQLWILFGLYGVYYGLAEGVARAFVADLVPEQLRQLELNSHPALASLAVRVGRTRLIDNILLGRTIP